MDRTTSQGLRLGHSSTDLIGDIHRQQRRRLLRRAAQVVLLAVLLLAVGLAVKAAADGRARARALAATEAAFGRGTVVELRGAAEDLAEHLEQRGRDDDVLATLALVRAQLYVEFGEQAEAAIATVSELDDGIATPEAEWARALLALAAGETDRAVALAHPAPPDATVLVPGHDAYVRGLGALASGPDAVLEARAGLDAAAGNDTVASHARLRIALALAAGDAEGALDRLARAREQYRTHMGLAADEALYHAYLRRELSGVADVADQLLATDGGLVSARDRMRARLSRAVVFALGGERERGLEEIREIFPQLPPWDPIARELSIRTLLEAGEADQVAAWIDDAGLPPTTEGLYRAWIDLVRGDAASALARLAELPQALPRVAYLQALALVEQGRYEEAGPWVERALALLPGRTELEVAKARVELHTGDPQVALRKLESLAHEETYAPRAWTALGEAYLHVSPPNPQKARRALERALEREPHPAEAAHLLAKAIVAANAGAENQRRALELEARAVRENPYLPRYREALARMYAEVGQVDRAIETARTIADDPAVDPALLLDLARWHLLRAERMDRNDDRDAARTLVATAERKGAPKAGIAVARARLALASKDETDMQAAADELSELLQAHTRDVEAWVLLARLQAALGDRKTAEKTLRRALAHLPDAATGPVHLEWARLEARKGARRKAAARARVAWSRLQSSGPPEQRIAAARLATKLWLRLGKPKTALLIARQLTDRLPNRADAWL
ncbi:MAG: tetratricopeptide repeat protein, partial [Deltaproteobacteria bacterium]